ncbi:MAG TPA: hypothetical protein VMT68_09505 [Caulobacteraceae bacterium]|nr:hypothetical protein [Caulobacteraceae bacterium]
MDFLKDRRLIAFGGAGVALAAGLLVAWVFLWRGGKPTEPPPASQGGLVVVSGRDDDAKLDPKRPLRCFVGGQFVGELPLAVCAQRNGVAAGALDVGLDQAGALAAGNTAAAPLTPLTQEPPQSLPETSPSEPGGQPAPLLAQGGGQACWRFDAGGWRQLPTPMSLQTCVQALFANRCPSGDDAFYGRWGEQTIRLTAGRVEVSPDNRDFTPLLDPWPACEGAEG